MASLSPLETLNALEQDLDRFSANSKARHADRDSEDHPVFFGFFAQTCDVVRACSVQDSDFGDVVAKASRILNKFVHIAYGALDFESLPSLAHSTEFPVLEGPHREKNVFSNRMRDALKLMERWIAQKDLKKGVKSNEDPSLGPKFPKPWSTTHRPHPLTTPLSRFEDITAIVSQATGPLHGAVYDARCEIISNRIFQPSGHLTNTNSCLVVTGTGGYKERSPMLTYYLLEDDTDQFKARQADVGLSDLAFTSAIDESSKLIFIADGSRIKSYAWADPRTGKVHKKGLAAHTLRCEKHQDGPLHILSPGRLIRAGKGGAAVWKLNGLKTHGANGNKRIGVEFDASDSWRDDSDEIETSTGSKPTSTISFVDQHLTPAVWHAHPSSPATMLCASDPEKSNDFSFVAVDLEHGGATVARYLGHAGSTAAFSTSSGDANVFATAANDGHARLYDHRSPLPVLTLRAGDADDECSGVVFVHPDGVPTVFTGATRDEVIRLWDVRAKKMVYELSTGNSAVVSMAWDEPRSSLYVSTACEYMNRMGENFEYRRATVAHGSGDSDGGDDEYDSEEYDDDGPCWPKNAALSEDYFGHLFDAGDHRIFRYAFKDQSDPSILPEYGHARVNSGRYGW